MSKIMLLFLILCGVILCVSSKTYRPNATVNPRATALLSGGIPLLSHIARSNTAKTDPLIYKTTMDMVKEHGYPVQSHTVVTEDGYVLNIFRIPGSPKSPPSARKTPVLAMHGLTGSSDILVLLGPEKSIGFLLADEGYDVWLANSRGNMYSRKHVSLSPDKVEFWNFTFHENGVYDLPAMIDYIINFTGQKQIMYIGHSLGCTTFFVMASTRPEYNQKIKLMIALAPAVFLRQENSPLFKLGFKFFKQIYEAIVGVGVHELLSRNKEFQQVLSVVCRENNPNFQLCLTTYFLIFGGEMKHFDKSTATTIVTHFFSGTSINTVAHLLENFKIDRFQLFDPTISSKKIMPTYNMSQVVCPVALYCGDDDIFSTCEDVKRVGRQLGNAIATVEIEAKGTSHLDFVIGKQARKYIYEPVFKLMKKYQ